MMVTQIDRGETGHLVISRRKGDWTVLILGGVVIARVKVQTLGDHKAQLYWEVPKSITVLREELIKGVD